MDIKSMTVAQAVESISNKSIKIKDIAEFIGKSDRTVQTKIKKLGYIWDAKKGVYEAIGEEYNPENDSKQIMDFLIPSPINTAVRASKQVSQAKREVSSTKDDSSKASSKKKTNADYAKTHLQSQDSIDRILEGKQQSRVQRAYYIDQDLADIIDGVDGKQKSNLVNECIRKVFEEKGIL